MKMLFCYNQPDKHQYLLCFYINDLNSKHAEAELEQRCEIKLLIECSSSGWVEAVIRLPSTWSIFSALKSVLSDGFDTADSFRGS